MRRLLAALIVGALLAAACTGSDDSTASSDPGTPNTSAETTLVPTSTTAAASPTSSTAAPTTTTMPDPTPQRGGMVVIGDDQEPPTLNPYVPGGDNAIVTIVGQAHMAGAYDIDAHTRELIPELVLEVPTVGNGGVVLNEDGTMTVRWLIRDDAVWSDGVPITGTDFAFTLEFQSATNECWDPDSPFRPEPFDPGGEIEDLDTKTIAIRFEQPGFQHEDLFNWIVPKHAVENTDYCEDWNETTWPAAGPFVVTEWDKGSHIELVRNANYWKRDPETGIGLPYLDEVEFRFIPETEELIEAFGAEELDVIQPPPFFESVAELPALEGVDVQILRGREWEHLNFQFGPDNRNPESMNESHSFRQAVAHALDRDLLVQELWSGMLPGPSNSFLDTMITGISSQPWSIYEHDPERAAALVATACEELGRDCEASPPQIVFSTTSNSDIRYELAQLLPAMLAESGIGVRLELEDQQIFFGDTLDNGDWDVGFWAWKGQPGAAGVISAMDVFDPDGAPPDGRNYYRWGAPNSVVADDAAVAEFRDVLAEMRTSYDYDEVKRLAGVLELILAEQVVVVPVSSDVTVGAVWANEIAGFRMNPTQAGHTWNVEQWHRIDL